MLALEGFLPVLDKRPMATLTKPLDLAPVRTPPAPIKAPPALAKTLLPAPAPGKAPPRAPPALAKTPLPAPAPGKAPLRAPPALAKTPLPAPAPGKAPLAPAQQTSGPPAIRSYYQLDLDNTITTGISQPSTATPIPGTSALHCRWRCGPDLSIPPIGTCWI